MNNFKNIKSIYNSQDTGRLLDVPDQLKKKIKRADRAVNSSHIINIIILVVTFLVVACSDIFFFKSPSLLFQIGIITMLSALFVRIGFEIFSYRRKKSLNVLNESENFMKDLKEYYNWRKKIHEYPTYLTFLLYVIGVGLLFVEFHVYLPQFWFLFFLVEFVVIAIVLFFFIRKKVRNEVRSLSDLIVLYSID